MQIHLDLLGGLAGDMFIAGLLNAFPEHEGRVVETIGRLARAFDGVPHVTPEAPAPCRLLAADDGVLSGSRFVVDDGNLDTAAVRAALQPHRHDRPNGDGSAHGTKDRAMGHDPRPGSDHLHGPDHDDHEHDGLADGHTPGHTPGHEPAPDVASRAAPTPAAHVDWSTIRRQLQASLPPPLARHALAIFSLLAEAEAEVHGVAVDRVAFHEVGAWDSVADICGAACLIDALSASRWTCSAVPLGGGRVGTAHGPLPVPAPASALLLRGFELIDDGISGERVTPTGAAILKYLVPPAPAAVMPPQPRQLSRSGVGFGTRRLPGISNCVRVLVFDEAPPGSAAVTSVAGGCGAEAASAAHRELAVVEFEVDDQSAEDLAMGLDRLRGHAAVFDVVQAPVFGKKGRMMTAVRLLARPAAIGEVIDACFRETTTIGLRHSRVHGAALPRRAETVDVDGHAIRVKAVRRPGGDTAKAESDDALAHESHAARQRLRREAERRVLATQDKGADLG